MRAGRFHSALLGVALLASIASGQSVGRAPSAESPAKPEPGERAYAIRLARFHLYRAFLFLAQSVAPEDAPRPPAPKPTPPPRSKPSEDTVNVTYRPMPRKEWPPIARALLQQSVKRVAAVETAIWVAPAVPLPAPPLAPAKESAMPRVLPPPLDDSTVWTKPQNPRK